MLVYAQCVRDSFDMYTSVLWKKQIFLFDYYNFCFQWLLKIRVTILNNIYFRFRSERRMYCFYDNMFFYMYKKELSFDKYMRVTRFGEKLSLVLCFAHFFSLRFLNSSFERKEKLRETFTEFQRNWWICQRITTYVLSFFVLNVWECVTGLLDMF